ncbi:MAG: hypothetical protein BGO51_09365 [Rhodospirillales bacterium 69-11]|nr:hypothetical protein [Rhodospirillales bacterium]OJW26282.1 MAG: hypothetical protein BGO51_09365 [Rhodospirillales bacterium 69-11]
MRRAVPILLALALAACTNGLAARQAQLAPLIGQREGVLVQQLGVPNRVYETQGVKYLAYDDGQTEIVPGTPGYPFGPPFWGPYGGLPPQVITTVCETTFAVVDGTVRSFTLRGNGCG